MLTTDALDAGDTSVEAQDLAMQRMISAGVVPMTTLQTMLEWQRDWARRETYVGPWLPEPVLGEGALRVDGKSVGYYSTTAGSIGLQAGAQSKSEVIVFMTEDALKAFQASSGWEAGVDGNIAVVEWGAGQSLTTVDVKDPIVGFIYGSKGLMYNLTLEGTKFTKIER